jgi:hypothetical protein
MPFGRGPVASGMVVPEFDAIMNVVADRLNPLPAAGDPAEHCPCLVRELLRVAVSAAQQIGKSIIGQVAHRPLFGLDVGSVRKSAVRDQELVADFDVPEGRRGGCRRCRTHPGNHVLRHSAKTGWLARSAGPAAGKGERSASRASDFLKAVECDVVACPDLQGCLHFSR